ncbi:hypothetical protein NC653_037863 [Populus alba x Populus x berolinensis]|uniref:Uncharacterized protein n=1 Tax=Populus alba x Populus x berolinensis TaxID=444605 RepID=A0AAD6LF75_9ROSI|nr:hypothetical protein NC653_037863 [Populus alba x Populus x berolinensis]
MEMDSDDSASEASEFLSCISRFFMSKARCVVPSDSEDTNNPPSSDSISFESPPRLVDLAVSFQVFLDLAEMEMIKAKKASRSEAEKRRMELEAELTRMMLQTQLQTQLQIASIVAGKGPSRKQEIRSTELLWLATHSFLLLGKMQLRSHVKLALMLFRAWW